MNARHSHNRVGVAQLRKMLSYDMQTGLLRWIKPLQRSDLIGKVAGSLSSDGYIKIDVGYEKIGAHIVAWALVKGAWPTHRIDHRDGSGSNNRWENLRRCSHGQNIANAKTRVGTSSGIKGVARACTVSERWIAYIGTGGKLIHLGTFPSKKTAAAARRKAAMRFHGAFARH